MIEQKEELDRWVVQVVGHTGGMIVILQLLWLRFGPFGFIALSIDNIGPIIPGIKQGSFHSLI